MGAADSQKVLAVYELLIEHLGLSDVAYDFGDGNRPAVSACAFSDFRVFSLARPERVRGWPHGDRWWFEVERWSDDEDDYVVYWSARYLCDTGPTLPDVQVGALLIAEAVKVTETRNRHIWQLEDSDTDDKRQAGRVLDRRLAELRTQYGRLYERWSTEGSGRPWLPTYALPN
ncbi:hypothetical protein MRBLWH7_001266 [Microbacterium sp. LWH7-1.2]|uniref:hypothetical protein n=1 Tax=Microbacterium sp. LWH7-1.2 TaxID=3135257 RepID=UPI00313A4446